MRKGIREFSRRIIPLLLPGLFLFSTGCSGEECEFAGETPQCPPRIVRIFRCDDYGREGCQNRPDENGEYEIEVPSEWLISWRRLGQYMYFHSRITPGVRVDLERPLGPAGRDRLQEDLRCSFTLQRGERRVGGKLEGARVDERGAGFWCFDYLGEMLLKYHKKFGTLDRIPDPGFFPVELRLGFEGSRLPLRGGINSTVGLRWTAGRSKN